jgi:SAM-dependent methyltransferase
MYPTGSFQSEYPGFQMKRIFLAASGNARRKRAKFFLSRYQITEATKILDLGSEDGSAIAGILKDTAARPENIYIADINAAAVAKGAAAFGFQPVTIDEDGRLPFPDGYFDIVFCSSVIEHVTVAKEEVWTLKSGSRFKSRAATRQKSFANEIRRVGKLYFVQTPYVYFPIESHSWLPFVGYLPRRLLLPLLKLTNLFWVKRTSPDWYLLNRSELSKLFPEAEIVKERAFGLTKSIMAVRN